MLVPARSNSTFLNNPHLDLGSDRKYKSSVLSKFPVYSLRLLGAFAATILLSIASGQTLVNLGTQSRNIDFSTQSFTRPTSVGSAAPSTCQTGQLFFNSSATPGNNLFGCSATNIWSQLGYSYNFLAPFAANGNSVSLPQANSSTDGYLLHTDWNTFNAKQPAGNYLTGLTGDITAGGPGTASATLATVNNTPGSCGDSTHVCQVTTNGKGLVTGQSAVAISGGGGGASSSSQLSDFTTTDTTTTTSIAAGIYGVGNSTWSLGATSFTLKSLAVTGVVSDGGPIQIQVASTTGMHSGDSVTISGVGGVTAANGTWAINIQSSTAFDLMGSTFSGSYTGGGTVQGTGSGTMYIEGNDSGIVSAYYSSSVGGVMTCSGTCVENQMTTPAFDGDAVPIAVVTISGGAFSTVTDKRRFMSNRGITAGLGIAVTDTGGSASVAVDSTVARTTGANTFTQNNTFTGGYILIPAGSQPACNAGNEGWFWYTKGSGTTNGAFQICQNQSGSYLWVTH